MSSLPEILSVKPMSTVENMTIKTEVLDPINISQSECTFQLSRNGILDGGSFVSLAVTCAAGGFLPLDAGIYSLVKSAHLLIGGKEIASCTDCGHYESMVSKFTTPEHRAFVDSVKSGRTGARYNEVDEASGRIMPTDLVYTNFSADATATAVVAPQLKPGTTAASTPVFSVPLSSLIPMMKSRPLPLFAIQENVFIRLVFRQQSAAAGDVGNICCFPAGHAGSTAVSVATSEVKFYSDHLYYEDATMEDLSRQVYSENGLSYLYEDQILTVAQIPAVANPGADQVSEQSVERDIAVAGRTVRSLLVQERFTNATANRGHDILGKYHASTLDTDDEYNFRINEIRVYDRDVSRPSQKFTELSQVFNVPLQVPSQLYSMDVDSNKQETDKKPDQNTVYIGQIEGHQLPDETNAGRDSDIRGTSHMIGLDLTTGGLNVLGNGRQVGSKPIIIQKKLKRTNNREGAREMRIYASVERLMTLRAGKVIVSA